jgi:hypothetical protein
VNDSWKGKPVYSRSVLRIYDLWMLAFSCRLSWRCPKSSMLANYNYNYNLGRRHLDVGVGTGYFLDRCRFRTRSPS